MGQRYEVAKRPLTEMEKRFFPDDRDKPFTVVDTRTGKPVGRRYSNLTGAQTAADGRNTKAARKARLAARRGQA